MFVCVVLFVCVWTGKSYLVGVLEKWHIMVAFIPSLWGYKFTFWE